MIANNVTTTHVNSSSNVNLKALEFAWRLQNEEYYDALQVIYEYNELVKKSDYIDNDNWQVLFDLLTADILMVQDRFKHKDNIIQLMHPLIEKFNEKAVEYLSKDVWLKTIVVMSFCAYYLLLDEDIQRTELDIKNFEYTKKVCNELCDNKYIKEILDSFFAKIDNEHVYEYDVIYTNKGIPETIINIMKITDCFK